MSLATIEVGVIFLQGRATRSLFVEPSDSAPWDQSSVVSGGHLLDVDGLKLERSNLAMSLITLCMLTALDLSRKQVRHVVLIVEYAEPLFHW